MKVVADVNDALLKLGYAVYLVLRSIAYSIEQLSVIAFFLTVEIVFAGLPSEWLSVSLANCAAEEGRHLSLVDVWLNV